MALCLFSRFLSLSCFFLLIETGFVLITKYVIVYAFRSFYSDFAIYHFVCEREMVQPAAQNKEPLSNKTEHTRLIETYVPFKEEKVRKKKKNC
jgi:hypothetical protein